MRPSALIACMLLTACGRNMVQQARYDAYERGDLFPDGMAMQVPPQGTAARDALQRAAETRRPPMSRALIERGQARFDIFCTPCHGRDGSGDGVIPSRGFPTPPDFHSQRLRNAPDGHFYQVMTQGYGVMYSYADRVPPQDRWAIAAYIRALQATGLPERSPEAAHAFR